MRMFDLEARGRIEVTSYGIKVDNKELLQELEKAVTEDGGSYRFAGSVKIIIDDLTEPLTIKKSEGLEEIARNTLEAFPFGGLIGELFGPGIDDAEEDEEDEEEPQAQEAGVEDGKEDND